MCVSSWPALAGGATLPSVLDALRGIGRALSAVAALALMCDPRDLGTAMGDATREEEGSAPKPGARGYDPTLFLYELCPGGTGLCERIFEQRTALLARAHKLVASCSCTSGCPACVGPVAPNGPLPTRKTVALELFAVLFAEGGSPLLRQRETAA